MPPKGQRRPSFLAGGAVLGGLALIALVLGFNVAGLRDRLWRHHAIENGAETTQEEVIHARKSIAVFGFKNLAAKTEVAWLSPAISEMLSTEMAAGGTLRIVPGEIVNGRRPTYPFQTLTRSARKLLAGCGKNLGADLVILGPMSHFQPANLDLICACKKLCQGKFYWLTQKRETKAICLIWCRELGRSCERSAA